MHQYIVCSGAPHPALEVIPGLLRPDVTTHFIGVDRGAWRLVDAGYDLVLALGDFDSVSEVERQQIRDHSQEFYQVRPEKDDTDTELALTFLADRFTQGEVYILGAIGQGANRLDHLVSNLYWPYQPRFRALIPRVTFIDATSRIRWFQPGRYVLEPGLKLPNYLSIIAMTPVDSLTIRHAKYELPLTNLTYPRAYISNEFINAQTPVEIDFTAGLLMVVWQSEDQPRK